MPRCSPNIQASLILGSLLAQKSRCLLRANIGQILTIYFIALLNTRRCFFVAKLTSAKIKALEAKEEIFSYHFLLICHDNISFQFSLKRYFFLHYTPLKSFVNYFLSCSNQIDKEHESITDKSNHCNQHYFEVSLIFIFTEKSS